MPLTLAIIVGLILGAAFAESVGGGMVGAILGAVLQRLADARKRLTAMGDEVRDLRLQTHQLAHQLEQLTARAMGANETRDTPPPVESAEAAHTPEETMPEAVEADVQGPALDSYGLPLYLRRDPAQEREQEQEQEAYAASVAPEAKPERALDTEPQPEPVPTAAAPGIALPQWQPGWFESRLNQAGDWLREYFTGGNLFVRVGMLVLFFGVAFLLKYAAQTVQVPVELRYVGVLLGASAMLALGWRLRLTHTTYALVMQGGAIALVYLTIFAAYRLHELMQGTTCFALLTLVVMLGVGVALLQNAMTLAVVAVAGGFASPLLASTGSGSHVALFGYYLVLNLGIVVVAWFRPWRLLNWLGFVFTFGIGMSWGYRFYAPEYFHSTEPFLIAFFLLYSLIPVLFALRQPPRLKGLVDGTLVFGTPTLVIGLQAMLVRGMPDMLAWSSAWMGAYYLLLVVLLRRRPAMLLLCESYLALGIAFLTLAIPLGFAGRVTSAIWAIEGLALLWVGLRQSRLLPRLCGAGLMLVAGVFYWTDSASSTPGLFLLNNDFIGCVLIALAGWGGYELLHRYRELPALLAEEREFLAPLLLVWGSLWWLFGGLHDINSHFDFGLARFASLVFVSLSAALAWWAGGRRRDWLLCALALLAQGLGLIALAENSKLLTLGWPWFNLFYGSALLHVVTAVALCLWAQRHKYVTFMPSGERLLPGLFWVGVLVFAGESWLEAHRHYEGLYQVTVLVVVGALFMLALVQAHRLEPWPVLAQPLMAALPALAVAVAAFMIEQVWFSEYGAWLVLPAALLGHYALLRWLERYPGYPLGDVQLLTAVLVLLALSWQLAQWLGAQPLAWEYGIDAMAWALLPLLVLAWRARWQGWAWPVGRYYRALGVHLPLVLGVALTLWLVVVNLRITGSGSQSYWPLLNPVDLMSLAVLLVLGRYCLAPGFGVEPSLRWVPWAIPAALGFYWLNMALFKGFYHLAQVPFTAHAQLGSIKVQSGLSLLWSVTATLAMLLGARRAWRKVWLAGAVLMGLTVLKLFATDLSGTGTVARIVAFIGVGLILLLVGYFAPVPPATAEAACDRAE